MRQLDAYAETAKMDRFARYTPMTTIQYLAAIKRLGLSQVGAGRVFGLSPRQSQRLASGESHVPEPVARLIRVMIAYDIKPEDIK